MFFKIVSVEAGIINVWELAGRRRYRQKTIFRSFVGMKVPFWGQITLKNTDKMPFFEILSVWIEVVT